MGKGAKPSKYGNTWAGKAKQEAEMALAEMEDEDED